MTEKAKEICAEALALQENAREALVRLLAHNGDDWIDPEIAKHIYSISVRFITSSAVPITELIGSKSRALSISLRS